MTVQEQDNEQTKVRICIALFPKNKKRRERTGLKEFAKFRETDVTEVSIIDP